MDMMQSMMRRASPPPKGSSVGAVGEVVGAANSSSEYDTVVSLSGQSNTNRVTPIPSFCDSGSCFFGSTISGQQYNQLPNVTFAWGLWKLTSPPCSAETT